MTHTRRRGLFHTVVAMGVALTGGTLTTACGSTQGTLMPTVDGGGEKDGDTTDAYPTIHSAPPADAGDDGYQTIGIYVPDGGDAYPTIGTVDASDDAYPIIYPAHDASVPTDASGADAQGDAYPMIGVDAG